jgi:hypothetical protein
MAKLRTGTGLIRLKQGCGSVSKLSSANTTPKTHSSGAGNTDSPSQLRKPRPKEPQLKGLLRGDVEPSEGSVIPIIDTGDDITDKQRLDFIEQGIYTVTPFRDDSQSYGWLIPDTHVTPIKAICKVWSDNPRDAIDTAIIILSPCPNQDTPTPGII